MKRFRLASKLALAIVPIALVAVAAGALVSWTFLEESRGEERAAQAARVAADAMDALNAVSQERAATLEAALGESPASLQAVRNASDRSIEALRDSVRDLVPLASGPASGIASTIFSQSSLAQARLENSREADPLSVEASDLIDDVGNRLITVASQSTLYFGDPGPSREGAGAVSLAEASFASFQQEELLILFEADQSLVPVEEFAAQFSALETTVVDWLENADNNSPTVRAEGLARSQVQEGGSVPDPETFLFNRDETLAAAASDILTRVAASSGVAATEARGEAATIAGVVIGVLFLTVVIALVVGRSTVRRVRSVTTAARYVADEELPKLVDALSNPKGKLEGTIPVELEQSGPDEVGELARSFGSLHGTLVDVANRQMDILRRGVSEIFVTLARRNGSLVDRQLALIDDLESREEDPETLGGYYKLDHLATRMRRNAESLLVLAGSESPRMWSEPLEIGDVVRAALGEVDEYQRIDVLALEPARLEGRVITDLAHLMSELLDNATQFSPPSERVRVTGLFDDDGYVITIADSGLGISEERMAEINRLIDEPPVLGLALEPTLGMYVVARLAGRHGIHVRLVPGVPGTTVRITLPRALLETAAAPEPEPAEAPDDVVETSAGNGQADSEPKSATIPPYAFGRATHQDKAGYSPPTGPPVRRPITDEPGSKTAEADTAKEAPEPTAPTTPDSKPAAHDSASAGPSKPAGPSTPAEPTPEAAPEPRRPTTSSPPTPTSEGPTAGQPSDTGPAALPRRPATAARHSATPLQRNPRSESPGPPPPSAPSPRPTRPVDGDNPTAPARPSLPTRRPGSSFQGDTEREGTSTVSARGAEGIRNALDVYRQGRDIARPESPGEADSDPEERSDT